MATTITAKLARVTFWTRCSFTSPARKNVIGSTNTR